MAAENPDKMVSTKCDCSRAEQYDVDKYEYNTAHNTVLCSQNTIAYRT
jgi:hypothetical protein